jgi:hypothetical protein
LRLLERTRPVRRVPIDAIQRIAERSRWLVCGFPVEYVHGNTSFGFVGEIDINALLADLERSRAAGLRAWAVLEELRAILTGAGQDLPKADEKSFVKEGAILERGLRQALTERGEALKELAAAARWVDRSAFGKEECFGQAHQALLKALDKASVFV